MHVWGGRSDRGPTVNSPYVMLRGLNLPPTSMKASTTSLRRDVMLVDRPPVKRATASGSLPQLRQERPGHCRRKAPEVRTRRRLCPRETRQECQGTKIHGKW